MVFLVKHLKNVLPPTIWKQAVAAALSKLLTETYIVYNDSAGGPRHPVCLVYIVIGSSCERGPSILLSDFSCTVGVCSTNFFAVSPAVLWKL